MSNEVSEPMSHQNHENLAVAAKVAKLMGEVDSHRGRDATAGVDPLRAGTAQG